MAELQYYGTGRRKRSVARVYLRPGQGQIMVNKRPLEVYFPDEAHQYVVRQPLELTENLGRYDALINVNGGGISGQAGAVRHGMARALLQIPEADYREPLKRARLLTRDARKVERKKYGRPGARKRFQYSKR